MLCAHNVSFDSGRRPARRLIETVWCAAASAQLRIGMTTPPAGPVVSVAILSAAAQDKRNLLEGGQTVSWMMPPAGRQETDHLSLPGSDTPHTDSAWRGGTGVSHTSRLALVFAGHHEMSVLDAPWPRPSWTGVGRASRRITQSMAAFQHKQTATRH